MRVSAWVSDRVQLVRLSLRWQFGRYAWLGPLLALLWPAFQALRLIAGWRTGSFEPADAQNVLLGVPLCALAIALGVRIIAAEIEQRTLEVTYTVPGGARRVWIAKLWAAGLVLLVTAVMLAAIAAWFFTPVSLGAFYGAFQGAIFFLVLSAGLGALLKSELTAALAAAVALFVSGAVNGFGDYPRAVSPLFNPLAVSEERSANVLAWTVQNRIGVALVIVALVALASVRAERREQLLRI